MSRLPVIVIWSLLAIGITYVASGLLAQDAPIRPMKLEADTATTGGAPRTPQFDPALVAKGKAAFNAKCTTCHDADRTLCKRKSLSSWKACVRRMSEKDGAEITPNDVDGITEYIAAICAPTDGGATGDPKAMIDQEDPAFAVFGTISPVWRGGGGPGVQDNQFFPEMFIGGEWQGKVVSARVTACTACHGVGEDAGPSGGFLGRIDLVEAAVKLDIATMLTGTCPREWQLSLDAGRFIVPFGAFSSQVNPGVYRTVSKPLMFNMGQRVIEGDLGDPVLPMPFSDEGASLNGSFTLFSDGGMEPITLNYERLRREWFERWRWWHQFRHEPQYRDAEQQPVGGRPRVNRQSLGASWQLGDRRTLQR